MRDLDADLALCDAFNNVYIPDGPLTKREEMHAIWALAMEARTGWPEAIKRAKVAEAEVVRLRRLLTDTDTHRHLEDALERVGTLQTEVARLMRQNEDWQHSALLADRSFADVQAAYRREYERARRLEDELASLRARTL